MSLRLLAAASVALVLSLAPLAHAQQAAASAPAAAPAVDVSQGKVAYYGRKFAGRKTASGERFDPNALTMAHKTLPFGTMVRVTNPNNKRSVIVRVNDRGPTNPGLVGDLSLAAARKLNMLKSGVIEAKFEVVSKGRVHRAKRARQT